MKAAVVSSFDHGPRYEDFPTPSPRGEHELVVDVVAAGLHPRVRSQANGSHYTSTDQLPLIPGIDGVGVDPDGRLRYFVLPDTTLGAMAEQTLIDPRRSIVLPENTDPVAIAAAMNPAMSSWVALRRRIDLPERAKVLILGATGSAGQLAVQVAKLFRAEQIIAAGRSADRLATLPALGATDTVLLDDDPSETAQRLGRIASDVDVVIDYLWGEPTAIAMAGIVTARSDRNQPLSWIEIGSAAGATAAIPSAALRAARIQLVGSGQGSVGANEILAELPALAREIANGSLVLGSRTMPLSSVEEAWAEPAQGIGRIVVLS